MKKVYVYAKEDRRSRDTAQLLAQKLMLAGFSVSSEWEGAADYIACVGGDATLLRMLAACDFPAIPIAGVNTGHLGFFQEFLPEDLDQLVDVFRTGQFYTQKNRLLRAVVTTDDGSQQCFQGLNDIVIRQDRSALIHLNMTIGPSFIERFSGDGLLFASAAGSTAYNYSLGGSIVDPRVSMMQITPMAPANSTAFRCFTSSLLVPADMEVIVYPDKEFSDSANVIVDGTEHFFDDIREISIGYADAEVKLVRLENYDFWSKVKSKFL